MVILEIGKEKYTVKDISDLNYSQYIYLNDLLEMEDIPEIELLKGILKLLTNYEGDYDILSAWDIAQIDFTLILKDVEYEPLKNIGDYEMIELDKITFQRYIDFDSTEDKSTIFALMYLPTEFENKDFEYLKEKFNTLPIKNSLSIVSYFYKWKDTVIKKYPSLFETIDLSQYEEAGEEPPKINNLDNWREITNSLAENILDEERVLSLNIYKVLNWLTIEKNKYEKQKQKE